MTANPPTIAQQIEGDELEAVSTALDAAAETLKTLDFAREAL